MRSFNVSFYDMPDKKTTTTLRDETQLDIKESDFETMFNELMSVFEDFCLENNISPWVVRVEEVPYDGDELE